MKLFLAVSFLFFCLSCNHTMFIHKKNVIHNQKGYILFYYENEEALFFPYKDTIDSKFLNQNHLDGYRIGSGEKDLEYLKNLAIKQAVVQNVLQNGQSIQVDERLKLIPVNIQYYWGDNLKLRLQKTIDNKNNIKFQYAEKEVDFYYRLYDHRYIMSITPLRKSDISRIEKYVPPEPKN